MWDLVEMNAPRRLTYCADQRKYEEQKTKSDNLLKL